MVLDKRLIILVITVCQCNDIEGQMEAHIIGGHYGSIYAHPHMVCLDVECGLEWKCGGSILNQRIILTAAHCLFSCQLDRNDNIIAYAGHENLKKMTATRQIIKVTTHIDYDENTVVNDIGLAYLSFGFVFGRNIKRVIIDRSFPKGVIFGHLAGWGFIDEKTEELPHQLKWLQQQLRSKSTCSKIDRLHPGMFCAGSIYEWRPARGDSGGPLIIGKSQEIGILSWNNRTLPALPIYTNISYYYSWIKFHSRLLYCQNS